MNWEAISAVAQILGVIVVVITLIHLAAQVRQGNLLAKSQARQRMVEQAGTEAYKQMGDPSITYANVKEGSTQRRGAGEAGPLLNRVYAAARVGTVSVSRWRN